MASSIQTFNRLSIVAALAFSGCGDTLSLSSVSMALSGDEGAGDNTGGDEGDGDGTGDEAAADGTGNDGDGDGGNTGGGDAGGEWTLDTGIVQWRGYPIAEDQPPALIAQSGDGVYRLEQYQVIGVSETRQVTLSLTRGIDRIRSIEGIAAQSTFRYYGANPDDHQCAEPAINVDIVYERPIVSTPASDEEQASVDFGAWFVRQDSLEQSRQRVRDNCWGSSEAKLLALLDLGDPAVRAQYLDWAPDQMWTRVDPSFVPQMLEQGPMALVDQVGGSAHDQVANMIDGAAHRVLELENEELPAAEAELAACEAGADGGCADCVGGEPTDCDELRARVEAVEQELAAQRQHRSDMQGALDANPLPAKPDANAGGQIEALTYIVYAQQLCGAAHALSSTILMQAGGKMLPWPKWKIVTAKDVICSAAAWAAFGMTETKVTFTAVAASLLIFWTDQILAANVAAGHCHTVCWGDAAACEPCWATYTMHCRAATAAAAAVFFVEPVAIGFLLRWLGILVP
jgi:hypothetical protein